MVHIHNGILQTNVLFFFFPKCAFKYTAALARKKIKSVGAVKTEN